jgi:hypothetical protein
MQAPSRGVVTEPEHRAVDERERAARHRRERGIARFREQQLCKRNWINLKDIVEWYAERGGRFDAAERDRAYDLLVQDLLQGDFEEGGRSKILYLHPYTKMHRLTQQMLRDARELKQSVRSEYLDHCWLPRRLFDQWLANHELPASPPRFEPRGEKLSAPRNQRKRRAKQRTPRDDVADFCAKRWPDGRPANVTRRVIQREFERSPGGYLVDVRTIGRAFGRK